MNSKVLMIILAGGKGTRLLPITDNKPKTMIKINDKSVLEHIIDEFKIYGINNYIITTSHLANQITSHFGDGSDFGIKIKYFYEKPSSLSGSAGVVRKLKSFITGTFFVAYGDMLRKCDLSKLHNLHHKKKAIATINVFPCIRKNPGSIVKYNKDHKIIKFVETPSYQVKNQVWSNAGLYVFSPKIFSYIPKVKHSDFGKDIFPMLVSKKVAFYANTTQEYVIDIGTPERLKQARKSWNSQ